MTLKDQWICVYSSTFLHNVELIKHLLAESEVGAVVLNQKDSFYPVIGQIELYVQQDDVIRAKKIIEDSQL